MRSGTPGGNNGLTSYLILFLALSVGKLDGQAGYLGKRNEIGFDALAMIQEGYYELEYNVAASKHQGASFTFGYYSNSQDFGEFGDGVKYQDIAPVSTRTKGPVFGIGYSANSSWMDMPFPLGYTLSMHLKFGRLKAFDQYEGMDSEIRFENTFVSLQGKASRNYNLTPFLNLDVSALFGVIIHRVEREKGLSLAGSNLSREDLPSEPLRLYPLQYPLFSGGLNEKEETEGDLPPRLFLKPQVRLSYLF